MTIPEPWPTLDAFAMALRTQLGNELLSLALHGSLVLGDFVPDRSDVDLVALLAVEPSADLLESLETLHRDLTIAFPWWGRRLEVDYVSLATVRTVLDGRPSSGAMIRFSPGEPPVIGPAARHYLLKWAAARRADHAVAGAEPSSVLGPVDEGVVREVVLDHLHGWPRWVQDLHTVDAQVYAVLTLCRAAESLDTGQQVSKRIAAAHGRVRYPAWAELIGWASDHWFRTGPDPSLHHFSPRHAETISFVVEVCAGLLAAARTAT